MWAGLGLFGILEFLDPAWDANWTLHGTETGPCMDLNLDPAWISIWDFNLGLAGAQDRARLGWASKENR